MGSSPVAGGRDLGSLKVMKICRSQSKEGEIIKQKEKSTGTFLQVLSKLSKAKALPVLSDCCCLVTELCPALLGLHGLYRLPGSSLHGISQARILQWVAIFFSRNRTHVSCTGRQILYH